jgi:hypothetical protein
MLVGYVWPFLIYYLLIFVVSYIVVDYGQYYFYDEVTASAPAKVALGALILAAILTKTHSNFATMFTSDIASTVILAIAWSGVFILIYRFQPWHGFGLAMATLLIFAGMATLVVDSMLTPRSTQRYDTTKEYKPVRGPASGVTIQPKPAPATTTTPPTK